MPELNEMEVIEMLPEEEAYEGGLSTGAKAGIGVGIAGLVVGLGYLAKKKFYDPWKAGKEALKEVEAVDNESTDSEDNSEEE